MLGADCILLIVAALDDRAWSSWPSWPWQLGMDVLVEVHDIDELERALQVPAPLLGINNRNLRTFEVSLDTTLALQDAVPRDRRLVTESGIHTADDVARMRSAGRRRLPGRRDLHARARPRCSVAPPVRGVACTVYCARPARCVHPGRNRGLDNGRSVLDRDRQRHRAVPDAPANARWRTARPWSRPCFEAHRHRSEAVVFDFDHTLYDGDSGSHLFAWLIKRNWWRQALALLAAPVLGPMIAFLPTRRHGISALCLDRHDRAAQPPRARRPDRPVRRHPCRGRSGRACCRSALDVLHAHREAGDRVVIATGAPPELARAILAFVAHEDVPVIGTAVGPKFGGVGAKRHCHDEEKMRMLREHGYGDIDIAYSDQQRRPAAAAGGEGTGGGESEARRASRCSAGCCRPARRSSTGDVRTAAARRPRRHPASSDRPIW